MKYTKRFIEETFPVKEVSEISAKEKNIRHGHISTLHIWWARRPLAASRSTAFAALIPFPEDEETIKYFWSVLTPLFNKGILPKEKKTKSVVDAIKTFIIEMSRWENTNNKDIVEAAGKMILHFNEGIPPKVLDPFGGGGSIPLECLRLGCETYSNDLNPVAVLIQKCTLEYPQKYCKPGYVEREIENFGKKKKEKIWTDNVLLEDVKYWSNWVIEEAKKELAQFYPHDPKGRIPVGYIWAKTISCQNPSCGTEIPLLSHFWLSKKIALNVILYPIIKNKKIEFKIIESIDGVFPKDFDPDEGFVNRANVKCPVCKSVTQANSTRTLFIKKKVGNRLIAVITYKKGQTGKKYRVSNQYDITSYNSANKILLQKIERIIKVSGVSPLPDEETPMGKGKGAERAFTLRAYGVNNWSDIFNERQKLISICLFEQINFVKDILKKERIDQGRFNAIITFLALLCSKALTTNNSIVIWNASSESFHSKPDQGPTFSMQLDYTESNPFSDVTGSIKNHLDSMLQSIENNLFTTKVISSITNTSATKLLFENEYFDCIFTDPPYYDNFPYSLMSDFFYVWLKRSLFDIYPELFTFALTPKKDEIVVYTNHNSWDEAKIIFEEGLKNSFKEANRITKVNGIVTVVYAHKTTEGWETIINSLLESGLVVSSSWPLNTEREGRQRAYESAALASSIYIICRKIKREPTAFYNDVKEELKKYLSKKLDRLWNEGISGADFFIAAIGSSIEVFGKYQSVMDFEGNIIRGDKLLTDVRTIVTDYAVKKILHNGFASGISDLTRFYVLCRWEFKAAKIPFDEANKLSHSCHIELASLWQSKSFVKKDKEFVQILGPQDREMDDLEDSGELIDVLHYAIKLWEKGNKAEMQKVLNNSGFAKSDTFFRVAQAIVEAFPTESKDKEKLLTQGFLNLREKISDGFKVKEDTQGDFFK